jgi:hypothetical protein
MNAWNPDDALAGVNMQLDTTDIYLLESYLICDGKYLSLKYWKTKADKCAMYQKDFATCTPDNKTLQAIGICNLPCISSDLFIHELHKLREYGKELIFVSISD